MKSHANICKRSRKVVALLLIITEQWSAVQLHPHSPSSSSFGWIGKAMPFSVPLTGIIIITPVPLMIISPWINHSIDWPALLLLLRHCRKLQLATHPRKSSTFCCFEFPLNPVQCAHLFIQSSSSSWFGDQISSVQSRSFVAAGLHSHSSSDELELAHNSVPNTIPGRMPLIAITNHRSNLEPPLWQRF